MHWDMLWCFRRWVGWLAALLVTVLSVCMLVASFVAGLSGRLVSHLVTSRLVAWLGGPLAVAGVLVGCFRCRLDVCLFTPS